MKESKKTTIYLQKQTADVAQSSCVLSCLVSVLFSGTSLTKKGLQKLFFSFSVFGEFLNHLPNRNAFIVLETNTHGTGMNAFCANTHRRLHCMHSVVRVCPDYTYHNHTIIAWKTKMYYGQFLGHTSPLKAHKKLKTSRNVTDQQSSHLVCLIFAKTVCFSSYAWQIRRKKMNKIGIFVIGFLTVLKVSETNRADLALEQQRKYMQFVNFLNSSASFFVRAAN